MNAGDVRQFEWFAPVYDDFTPDVDASTLEDALDRAHRPIERVLDVGGGTGRAARAIHADRRIVADPALGMLERARDQDADAIRADGATLPLQDATVDAVLVVDALHHIADRRGTLRDAHRVLRPGGVLVVVEFDPTTVRGRLLAASEHLVGFDSTFDPPGHLRDDMERTGFDTTITDRGFTYTIAGTTPTE
jgi:demethylmenaquinone methyltransferase/2-methoxy-6-polyprenyl-1,4-benzoquinol methylase